MNLLPTIMIGCPTYDGQSYCKQEFFRSLQRFTYSNKSVYFSDNSATPSYAEELQKDGHRCGWVNPAGKTRIERIIDARNDIRYKFLESDAEYLLFLDSDVVVQKDAIEILLATGKDIVTGVYIIAKQVGSKVGFIPCVFDFFDEAKGGLPFPYGGDKKARVMIKQELYGDVVKEICFAGLGFVLIKRCVLEKISFRKEGSSDAGGEDIAFFMDARALGFSTFVNSKPGSFHMIYPHGKKENQFLLFKIRPKPMSVKDQELKNVNSRINCSAIFSS